MSKKQDQPKSLSIEDIATFCKRKGFVYPSSVIYGGISGFFDYGPLGIELFNNLKQHWWRFFVQTREDMLGLDASVISHPRTWKASGHLESFSDVSITCKKCKKVNKLDKDEVGKKNCEFCGGDLDKKSAKELNLLFSTKVGAENGFTAYLRGESAQAMFLDFKLITETSRAKLPFGIAQIGKCFRNEISPRDFLFRSREFTIAEFEFFTHPDKDNCELLDKSHLAVEVRLLDKETQDKGKTTVKKSSIEKMIKDKRVGEWHAYWLAEQLLWFKDLGINMEKIKVREHKKSELSHYSTATFDLDYEYPFGSKEVAGNANRGQYDLKQHMKESNESLELFDEESKKKIIPKVIEPTFGVDRVFLAILIDALENDKERGNYVLKINPKLAPVKLGVFPLVNKLNDKSREVYNLLKGEFTCFYDSKSSIGRRYARQDEIGTPICCTVDFQSLKDDTITLRDRDSTRQIRVKIKDLIKVLKRFFDGEKFSKLGKVI